MKKEEHETSCPQCPLPKGGKPALALVPRVLVIRPSVIYASAIPAAHTINTCHYRLYRLGCLILFIYYFIFYPSDLFLNIDLLFFLYYVLLLSIALRTNLDPAVYRLHCIFFPFSPRHSPSLGWPAITNNRSYRAISDQRPFLPSNNLASSSYLISSTASWVFSRVWLVHRDATCLHGRHSGYCR